MALWGNDDNIQSPGTVSLNYDTGIVTATGADFGTYGKPGDVLRFGFRGDGGTYFGDAVITSVSTAQTCSIANTYGLSGAAIAATSYYISELPVYTAGFDHEWSNKHDTVATYKDLGTTTAEDETLVGQVNIAAPYAAQVALSTTGSGEDALLNDGSEIRITGLGVGLTAATANSGIASDRIYADFPGIAEASSVKVTSGGALKFVSITGSGTTYVSIASTLSTGVTSGDVLTFQGSQIISLESGVTAGIATGDTLTFRRKSGGYDRQIYGISTNTSLAYDGVSTEYRTSGSGWVGVTTYKDCDGNFRVKSEILVAIGGASGIQTGEYGIAYPTPK